MPIKNPQPKVIVAMSGGVDSSAAAAILKKQGYDVQGAYIQVWSAEDYLADCPWQKEIEGARRVCEKLQIPFRTIHLEKEYQEKVVEYLIDGYRRVITPNPDIMCNREIKFGVFFNWAVSRGVDYLATGHYARNVKCLPDQQAGQMSNVKTTSQISNLYNNETMKQFNPPLRRVNNLTIEQFNNLPRFKLLKGIDSTKDQSYFLYTLTQEKLAKILFPIGEYHKSEVRHIAKKFRLHNWNKKDSQGICFIGKVELKNFLQKYIKPKKGPIITIEGKQIGEHDGIFYYTIGQRHGFGFAGGASPYYIVDRRIRDNTLIVAPRNHPKLYSQEIIVYNVNWIDGEEPHLPLKCKAKIRYQQRDQECEVKMSNVKCQMSKIYLIKFKKPQWAVAPGQSIVFYQKEECLGGGVVGEKLSASACKL